MERKDFADPQSLLEKGEIVRNYGLLFRSWNKIQDWFRTAIELLEADKSRAALEEANELKKKSSSLSDKIFQYADYVFQEAEADATDNPGSPDVTLQATAEKMKAHHTKVEKHNQN